MLWTWGKVFVEERRETDKVGRKGLSDEEDLVYVDFDVGIVVVITGPAREA